MYGKLMSISDELMWQVSSMTKTGTPGAASFTAQTTCPTAASSFSAGMMTASLGAPGRSEYGVTRAPDPLP